MLASPPILETETYCSIFEWFLQCLENVGICNFYVQHLFKMLNIIIFNSVIQNIAKNKPKQKSENMI